MNIGKINSFSSVALGQEAVEASRMAEESQKFSKLIEKMKSKNANSTLSSSQIAEKGRLNGDIATGFSHTYTSELDKNARPQGAAVNQSGVHAKPKTIDKTSELYEKSMELETYFTKQILSEMRKTIHKSSLGGNDFASEMYDDMLYYEYATNITKNAGFGLADQIYLSLVG